MRVTYTVPITEDNSVNAPPHTITDTILPSHTPAAITMTSTTCPNPATSDYLPPTTSKTTTTDPSISDGDSVITCPHCDRTFNSHISLVGHLRIHRTETGELVPAAPSHSRDRRLLCPHCPPHIRPPHGPDRSHAHPRKLNPVQRQHILRTYQHFPSSSHELDYQYQQQIPCRLTTSIYSLSLLSPPCTSRICLVGHFRIHRRETGEPVLLTPTYTHRTQLICPHCPRTFTHRMDLLGRMSLHENLR
ncbi:unnamed protein product [Schistocephalus solidus]|uniref:C2H2-type domain-containing protein n=1 Tax=Schistocephalus solidus TaxID=70667 RepID=A0A183SRD6_SCHSO|nr:unnamed protein product [Schistocephalus solidus]